MAVQFPNFLQAQLVKPDYSGLGDLFNNYYGGKALRQQDIIGENQAQAAPLELLMKQIQAEFARPNAEVALSGAKLGNQGKSLSNKESVLKLQQLKKQIADQQDIDNAIKAAIAKQQGGEGGGMQGGGGFGGLPSREEALSAIANQFTPSGMNQGIVNPQGMFNPELSQSLMDVMNNPIMKNPLMQNQPVTQSPLLNEHPEGMMPLATNKNERFQEMMKGNPTLYAVDQLWDSMPQAREAIAKRYGKKEIKKIFNKQTGATRIETTWPSGRFTVNTIMPEQEDTGDEIPLTKPGLSKVENEVRGTDSLMPYLDELIELSKPEKVVTGVTKSKLPYFSTILGFETPGNASATYHKTVKDALEAYMGSSTLPRTNESLQNVHDILSRGRGETDKHYHEGLIAKKKALLEKRVKNLKLMKKGLNRFGNTSSSNEKSYSSDEWEVTNE